MLSFQAKLSSHATKTIKNINNEPVIRIHLILKWMRIRILDPHRKKMDPDPGHFFDLLNQFKAEFSKIVSFFLFIFMLEGDEPYRNQEFFDFSFFNNSDLGFESKKVFYFCTFWLLFCPLDPGPLIRIFLRIRIQ